jgi:subtilisin family serine protease
MPLPMSGAPSRVPASALARTLTLASLLAALAACADTPTQPGTPGGTASPPPVATGPTPDEVVPGEVIVKMKGGANASVLGGAGVSLKVSGRGDRSSLLSVPRGEERQTAARLAADPNVEYAEPNYIRKPAKVDPRLWAFYNPGGLNMLINAPGDPLDRTSLGSFYASKRDADIDNIEGYARGGRDVVIGSIDTGVDFAHPEFYGRLIAGRDWIDGDNSPRATDDGHGTHTSGIMAGWRVGVPGVAGAASHVKVYVQRVCGPEGCPTSAIINAINAAADYVDANGKPLVAINISLGGYSQSEGEKEAIARATARGILVIASAGNEGVGQLACPACDVNAIAVGATGWNDALADYSQYGEGIDIVAPGGLCYFDTTEDGCIFSAVPRGYQWGQTYDGPMAGGRYAFMYGTSMAAPMVTGVAAVVASKAGLRGSALRDRILSTADDRGPRGYDDGYGHGRLNAYRAVTNKTLR